MNYGIEIEKLSFSYAGIAVLDNLSLTVVSGERVGIIGVSGGGKSTLLKLISGLYEVRDGRISVNGMSDSGGRRRNTAVVMQNSTLFPASIRDNISCGKPVNEAVIAAACEAAQLSEWIKTLPGGLDAFVGERGGKVSGGQAQRIAVARAIAKNAPVVLLDEPTSALDSETGAALIRALDGLFEGKTVLHVSHRSDTLIGCHRVLRLERGRLYAS